MNNKLGIRKDDWEELIKKYPNQKRLIKKLNNGYPVQYLLEKTNFYGYDFFVNKNVLIPRYETETLIENTITYLKELDLTSANLIDIGTGSGAIAITLKKELPNLNITALDISRKALKVAKKNAKLNNVLINFLKKDIFKYELPQNMSVIISNPPYIEEDSNFSQNILFEPAKAIFVSNKNPLIYYQRILEISKDKLTPNHLIGFEIDEDHGKELVNLAKEYYPNDKVILNQDLTGKDRYLFIISE